MFGRCKKMTGICFLCESGYWGNYCNDLCPENCRYSFFMCRLSDGHCYNCIDKAFFSGSCNVSCSDKWPNCKTCTSETTNCHTCKNGFWGRNCDQNCSTDCYECQKQTGDCIVCVLGLWGTDCSRNCTSDHCFCRVTDGTCERCENGYWGNNCEQSCDLTGCLFSRCEKTTGNCEECKTNYWGSYCNNSCEIEHCIQHLSCSKTTGPECYECEVGKWGVACENICPQNCIGDCQIKREILGSSGPLCYECKAGKWGNLCENNCPENCAGQCQIRNGHCMSCVPGYFGSACNQICVDTDCMFCESFGYWGINCENTCDMSHCSSQNCFKTNGTCGECEKHFWGHYCNRSCEITDCASDVECSKTEGPKCSYCTNGKWGDNCNKTCPDDCSSGCIMASGECRSNQKRPSKPAIEPYVAIFGIDIGSSFAVGLVFVLVAVFIRKLFWPRWTHGKCKEGISNISYIPDCTYANNIVESGLNVKSDDHQGHIPLTSADFLQYEVNRAGKKDSV